MKFIIILIGGLTLFLTSCTKKTDTADRSKNTQEKKQNIVQVTDSTTIDGTLLELINNNGKAILKVHSDKYTVTGELGLTPPCYFFYRGGEVQNFSYPDVKVLHTLGVLGNVLTDEEKKKEKFNREGIWGKGIQGIVIKKDSIIINKKFFIGDGEVLDSRNIGLDEKVFWDFAHTY